MGDGLAAIPHRHWSVSKAPQTLRRFFPTTCVDRWPPWGGTPWRSLGPTINSIEKLEALRCSALNYQSPLHAQFIISISQLNVQGLQICPKLGLGQSF